MKKPDTLTNPLLDTIDMALAQPQLMPRQAVCQTDGELLTVLSIDVEADWS